MTLSIEIRWLNKRKEAIQTISVGLSAGLKSLSNRLLQAFAHKALIGCFWSRFLIITVPYSPRTIILFLYAIARSSFVAGDGRCLSSSIAHICRMSHARRRSLQVVGGSQSNSRSVPSSSFVFKSQDPIGEVRTVPYSVIFTCHYVSRNWKHEHIIFTIFTQHGSILTVRYE